MPEEILVTMDENTTDTPTKKPDIRDLNTVEVLGLSELSKRWGVTKQRVDEITKRVPHRWKLDCGRIWLKHDIEEFEKTWTRTAGVHLTRRSRRG